MKITPPTKYLLVIFLISFILYFPSLSTFYTNDDFFLLKISHANSFEQFLNFFSLTKGPDGLGMYRPLTTQVFYFLAWKVFNLNSLGLHAISFGVFFTVIYLVYLLTTQLFVNLNFKSLNQAVLMSTFLYATSATHFGHLYYLAAFQELGLTLFFLLSILVFIKFVTTPHIKYLIWSILFFLLSLMSKETAVVLPLVLMLVYAFFKFSIGKIISPKHFLLSLVPYYFLLAIYFYMRFKHYGFATGDSYIWDFSIERTVNTLGWYGLWSFNLPEMLVDFVGPGVKFNPNLFKFWLKEIIPIIILFVAEGVSILYLILKSKFLNRKFVSLILFCIAWFITTLIPVLFLPLHKFTFYLTLPLIGLVFIISYLITNHKSLILNLSFCAIWLALSIATLSLTGQTHWITRGSQTALNVNNYFTKNYETLKNFKVVVFSDTDEDKNLPWSPSEIVKVVLSDQNYFNVFWDDKLEAYYYNSGVKGRNNSVFNIKSRQFLGY